MPSLAPLGSLKTTTVAPAAATRNNLASPPAQRSIIGCSATVGADEAFECSGEDYDDEDIASSMEENKKVEAAAARIDFNRFDYKNQDLNKLDDAELKAHKAKMEEGFTKNAIKKGDPGFQYDKRVDFKTRGNVVGPSADDSWDESDDEEDEGIEIVASSQVKSKPRGIGLAMRQEIEKDLADDLNDNDYFDDDFDDDF